MNPDGRARHVAAAHRSRDRCAATGRSDNAPPPRPGSGSDSTADSRCDQPSSIPLVAVALGPLPRSGRRDHEHRRRGPLGPTDPHDQPFPPCTGDRGQGRVCAGRDGLLAREAVNSTAPLHNQGPSPVRPTHRRKPAQSARTSHLDTANVPRRTPFPHPLGGPQRHGPRHVDDSHQSQATRAASSPTSPVRQDHGRGRSPPRWLLPRPSW